MNRQFRRVGRGGAGVSTGVDSSAAVEGTRRAPVQSKRPIRAIVMRPAQKTFHRAAPDTGTSGGTGSAGVD